MDFNELIKSNKGVIPTVAVARDAQGSATEFNAASADYVKRNFVTNDGGDIALSDSGAQAAIDTLTLVFPRVVQQKFYDVSAERFVPRTHGLFTFQENIITPKALAVGSGRLAGLVDLSTGQSRSATAQVSLGWQKIKTWGLQIVAPISFIEIQKAIIANNWNLVEAGIGACAKLIDQQILSATFVGDGETNSELPGLFTNPDMPVDGTTITGDIGALTTAQLETLATNIVTAFYQQNQFSGRLTTIAMGSSQMAKLAGANMGLVAGNQERFGPFLKIDYFKQLLNKLNRSFGQDVDAEVLATPYADAATNTKFGINKNFIVAYNKDEEVIRQDLGFKLQEVPRPMPNMLQQQITGLRTFTGVGVYRPLETLRFEYSI